ncbi:SDR family oxidoreductase [Variovorax sp. J31P207]|uniref:SDR family oxidoreductase n=1 Tax=Variovorax sp. J31P207 TaxID=3053510 RepID=UPI002576D636|nr:SDR family oxidoreductase [Variovorax sp. J31P207]MDM0069978.1 SDR family oxidoreductase [Variovorax sp. J31P207]
MNSACTPRFGFSDEELVALPTDFRDGLFDDQVVLVSGAGSGLGKAIAVLYARLGAKLVICGRNADRLEKSARLLRSLGADTLEVPMTIRDPEQADRLMDQTFKRFGRLDVLVNNAGGQFAAPAIDFTHRGWQAVIDTNLNGTWYMIQAAAKRWVARDVSGRVVNIVSTVWRGRPTTAHSCAARAGVIYLSKTLAVEWAPHRIQLNCVAPGVVETTGFEHYPPDGLATYYGQPNVMRRPGDAQDIAQACVYLTGSSAKFITGEVVTVDGGQQLWGDPWPAGRPDYFRPDAPSRSATDEL